MNFNLRMLNLWLGLCKGVPGLPGAIHDLGYSHHSIEQPFRNQDNDESTPELVICSEKIRHSILFEWKSGANTDVGQLHRYSRITATDLQRLAMLSVRATEAFDVVIVGRADHAERLKIGITGGSYPFPLLLVSDTGISLAINKFKKEQLNEIFTPVLTLERRWPLSFVPIGDGAEIWEVADVVVPKLIEAMQRRDTVLITDHLCPEICPLWSIMGRGGKGLFRKLVNDVLEEAANGEFLPYIKYTNARNGMVEILHNPLAFGEKRTSAAYRKLHELFKALRHRLLLGNKAQPYLPFGRQ